MSIEDKDNEWDFLAWVAPCIGARGYLVLGTASTDITLAAINTNITLQNATQDLDRWVNKWLR